MDRKESIFVIDNDPKLKLALKLKSLTDVSCIAHSVSYKEEKECSQMCSLS